MLPTMASVSTPQVRRSTHPAHASEALRNAAKPTAATSTTPISPAIENRILRNMTSPVTMPSRPLPPMSRAAC